jgi:cephalosporin-C deacetylase-like acetyl esterase
LRKTYALIWSRHSSAERSCSSSSSRTRVCRADTTGAATCSHVHRDAEDAVRRTLSYVDGVAFARRAVAPAHFGVGLRDPVCPPSTAFAAYNEYGAGNGRPVPPVRRIQGYPFNQHEGGAAVHVRRQVSWLRARLAVEGPASNWSP